MDKFESWLMNIAKRARAKRDTLLQRKGVYPTPANISKMAVSEMGPELVRALTEVEAYEAVLQVYKRMKR